MVQDFDPQLGGQAVATGLLARLVVFPVVSLRRRKLGDGDEATGAPYIPKSMQKGIAFALIAVGNGIGGVITGQPPFAAISAGFVGAAVAMTAYDVQHKRAGGDE